MALMLASAAVSGIGLFVYTQSSRLHAACNRLILDYEPRNSDDGISRKRRKVQSPEQPAPDTTVPGVPMITEQHAPDTTVPEVPMIAEQPSRVITLGREPDNEVDNTSAIYQNQEILADVTQYIDREDSNYNIAPAVSTNNDEEEDSDFLEYLDMEASRQDMERTGSANHNHQMEADIAAYLVMDDSDQDIDQASSTNNNQQQVASDVAAYLAMDGSDQYMEATDFPTKKHQQVAFDIAAYLAMDDSDQDIEPTNSTTIKHPQVASDVAAYLAMDDSDQDIEPTSSTNNNQEMVSDIAAYIAKDDSISSGDASRVTVVRFVEPEREPIREEEDFWLRPLVYNKKQPGPSPSVSSIGDIFEELGISPLDLNDGFEDDEPILNWIEDSDDDDELEELARGLAQRYRSARAGKQPIAGPAPKADPAGRIEELMALPSFKTLKISDESKSELKSLQLKAAEIRLVDQQREKLAKERLLREQALQKLKERTAKGPRQPMVAPLSNEWIEKIISTIELPEAEVVATTCQGIPLRRHDFATVVAAKTWLNDEIVNGALAELEKQINLVAGITDYKQQGRKCLVMNSFFWPRVREAGGKKTQSILRRMGVTPKNLLLMDTVLVPICQDYHWTLLVVQPKQRKVMHLDSFNRRSSHTDLALAWMSDYLGDIYHAKPWQVMVLKTPQQTNGYDCGVHAITNGVCLALGLDPLQSYNVEEMSLQRLRIAGVLLGGGWVGEFDLWQQ